MKPQPQVRIPTNIFENLLFFDLKGNHLKVILFIARFQFGFNRLKYCACTRAEMCSIGLDQSVISRIIAELLEFQIVIEFKDGFEINTNLEKWLIVPRSNTDIPRYKGFIATHAHLQQELIKRQGMTAAKWPP